MNPLPAVELQLQRYESSVSPPQGESPTDWRTTDFRMFRGGSIWRPPVLNVYSQSGELEAEPTEEEAPSEEVVKKGQLSTEYVPVETKEEAVEGERTKILTRN